LKKGGPPSKPKYEFTTDSELVLWRKDETGENVSMKKSLKFICIILLKSS